MEKTNFEKENDKNDIALFRFAIIAPLINNSCEYKSKEEFFRNSALKKYILPNGKEITVNPGTIKKWYLDYCKDGFECLKPKSRKDTGCSRTVPIECIDKIIEFKEKYPYITGKAIYNKLIEDGDILAKNVSLASLYRFLNSHNFHTHNVTERKAFEMEFANDCWQGDTSHGPILTIDGKKVQIFVDNGTPYKNKQLSLICASIGAVLLHAKAYSPQSKAKIERSFRTVKDNFLNCEDWTKYKSLEELNESYRKYITSEYNSKYHSGIEDIPRNRFQRDYDKLKFISSHEDVDKMFLHVEEKPVALDSTIRLGKKDFEVPQKYIKQRIIVKYSPEDLSFIYIYNEKTKELEKAYPVDKIANSKMKRNTISYS